MGVVYVNNDEFKKLKMLEKNNLSKYARPLQNVLLHVGTPCILVNDLLSDHFLFKRGKFPFWDFSIILQQWLNLLVFAKRWKKHVSSWKFLYASVQYDEHLSSLIKKFALETNNYYVVNKWFPGTLIGLSKLNEVFLPVPMQRKRERSWAKRSYTYIKGPWDVLVSLNIEQDTAAWKELTSYNALTILIASATNNPRSGAIVLPGNSNFANCLLFYFKFLNKIFHKQQFKFFFNTTNITKELKNVKKYKIRTN